jgi:hypothetical protein
MFGTALERVGGSIGAPSGVSSLNRNPAIRSSSPPRADGANEHISAPVREGKVVGKVMSLA